MALSQTELTHIALDITSGLSNRDRFSRLLDIIRQNLHCDAAALLAFQGGQFTPLAIDGLNADVLGRRFLVNEHPRLEAIARAGDIVRFPSDSTLADPYDGLIPNQGDELKVHACIGLPLFASEHLIGAITIDGFDPLQFDKFTNSELRSLSAIAAVSLNNALMIDRLEKLAAQSQDSPPAMRVGIDTNTDVEIIGQSEIMQSLHNEIKVVADTDLNVLILGETGTGKELVAKAVHQGSERKDMPLVYLNCAALPESIAESELFGHVKGAFTGAISNRSGKFELADKGTLFLDEIGELPLTLQSKLLRVLQYGDLQKIGDDRSRKVDVRIIAATNKDLKQEVLAGRFRADLYHRLSVFPLMVPPLKERNDDITLLSGYFVERCRQKLGIKTLSLSPASLSLLKRYQWPGNVRELEHVLHRAAVLAKAQSRGELCQISPHNLEPITPAEEQGYTPQINNKHNQFAIGDHSLKDAIDEFQSQYIRQALAENEGQWAATARKLKLDSGNLHRLAKRLKLK